MMESAIEAGDAGPHNTSENEVEDEVLDENLLITSGKRVLDEEKQSILFEILKCAVCLEIPKGKQNLQVRICEKGHHFCSPCHKKLRKCAICRGRLFIGRNFVVEELITKLGPNLGIAKCKIPPPEPAPKPAPGVFPCLHQCKATLPAGMMLPHIRKFHSTKIVENVRSNPYTGRFDWMFNITLTPNMSYTLSIQVSDMGLFTVVISFSQNNFLGYLQVLGDESISSLYQYQLTARINKENNTCNDFTASNCNMLNYKHSVEVIKASGHHLKIDGSNLTGLVNEKDSLQIIFSIWRANSKKTEKEFTPQTLIAEVPMVFNNDRRIRRNKTRNMRKKRLKEKLRQVKKDGKKDSNEPLVNAMSNLKIKAENK